MCLNHCMQVVLAREVKNASEEGCFSHPLSSPKGLPFSHPGPRSLAILPASKDKRFSYVGNSVISAHLISALTFSLRLSSGSISGLYSSSSHFFLSPLKGNPSFMNTDYKCEVGPLEKQRDPQKIREE